MDAVSNWEYTPMATITLLRGWDRIQAELEDDEISTKSRAFLGQALGRAAPVGSNP